MKEQALQASTAADAVVLCSQLHTEYQQQQQR